MAENEPWSTSVDELMGIFRDTLIALLPSMRRARIPWRSFDAYDAWDNITETLFEEIVVGPIRCGVRDFEMKIPRYGMTHRDLTPFSFIAVLKVAEAPLVFHRFDADDDTFSIALCFEIADWSRATASHRVPVAEASFSFQHRQPDGSFVAVSDLAIDL
jgi:hypothetical protein